MAKNKPGNKGFVYSTDPGFDPGRYQDEEPKDFETLLPLQQKLRLQLQTKHRGGKTATVVLGFAGKDADLGELAKKLKSFCGTGGSAKDGEIIIQGDQRERLLQWFLKHGYSNVKKSGG